MLDMQIRSSSVLPSVGIERNRHSYVSIAAEFRRAVTACRSQLRWMFCDIGPWSFHWKG